MELKRHDDVTVTIKGKPVTLRFLKYVNSKTIEAMDMDTGVVHGVGIVLVTAVNGKAV